MSASLQILIVEDDDFKEQEILSVVRSIWSEAAVMHARSVQQAVLAINSQIFQLIVLDIALPSHDLVRGGGAPTSMPAGGVEVLLELSYLGRSDAIIIVTQYPEVEIEGRLVALRKVASVVAEELGCSAIAAIQFRKNDSMWRAAFKKALEKVRGSNPAR
ncbi:response regulator [Antarcticirhabdus aurantiaca]|uniref:Uncharacterized protein n=1 Tax=Antarcticirhabdus aurantiaca TaxID=2606717 RepID=A0ACD4NMB1_9HYPH|nr:response regulator [Antarcticirhabdus aurantiaca]WAJ27848.1 hypothetical protein OXU80_23885 [Jeongeuplla avenae]